MPPASGQIVVTQTNPIGLFTVNNNVVAPMVASSPPASFRFAQNNLAAKIRMLLFKVEKNGSVFWVGAAVPENTTDLTRAHVFFHPTVIQQTRQGVHVIADDKDYQNFDGGWKNTVYNYIWRMGGQHAEAGNMSVVLFPFTTMAALGPGGPNMFRNRPVDTLNAIVQGIFSAIGFTGQAPVLSRLGAYSFSSGFMALNLFLGQMQSTGLIKEVIDFDGPFIVNHPKTLLGRGPDVWSKCFTQQPPRVPASDWCTLTNDHFANVFYLSGNLHMQIGWMTFYLAMLNTCI